MVIIFSLLTNLIPFTDEGLCCPLYKVIFLIRNNYPKNKKEVIMATQALSRLSERIPSVFDDFFKPWNEWFEGGASGRTMKVPAVNITEQKNEYLVSLAAPGLKKEDFRIAVDGNMLTISSEKEENKEEKDESAPARNTTIHLSVAVLHFLKRSTRRKLMQSMKTVC
jgi:hypothetical protein